MNEISNNHIGAYAAKTHLSDLLDRVERGEELVITRRGRPVARLLPARPAHDVAKAQAAVADLFAIGEQIRQDLKAQGAEPITLGEILSMRDDGRK